MSEIIKQRLLNQGFLNVTRHYESGIEVPVKIDLANGTQVELLDTGVLVLTPRVAQDYDLVFSAAIHGNETAPIELLDQLVADVLSEKISVNNRTLILLGNPVAMNQGRRFMDENMNRLFSGAHSGKEHPEAKRAALLEKTVQTFFESRDDKQRIHYDLHTAIRGSVHRRFAVYPFTPDNQWDWQALKYLYKMNIKTVLLGHKPSTTFSYFSHAQFDAQAFTLELGQVKPFGENDPQEFSDVYQVLVDLLQNTINAKDKVDGSTLNIFDVKQELIKHSDSFRLNFSETTKNFTEFDEGDVLSDDHQGGYRVQSKGEAIVFPNANIPVGQRAGLIVQRRVFTQMIE